MFRSIFTGFNKFHEYNITALTPEKFLLNGAGEARQKNHCWGGNQSLEKMLKNWLRI